VGWLLLSLLVGSSFADHAGGDIGTQAGIFTALIGLIATAAQILRSTKSGKEV